MNERLFKKNILMYSMQSMTNIKPTEEQIKIIEDIRLDFKNLTAKIINCGNDETNIMLSVRHLEDALYRSLKSILMEKKEDA